MLNLNALIVAYILKPNNVPIIKTLIEVNIVLMWSTFIKINKSIIKASGIITKETIHNIFKCLNNLYNVEFCAFNLLVTKYNPTINPVAIATNNKFINIQIAHLLSVDEANPAYPAKLNPQYPKIGNNEQINKTLTLFIFFSFLFI